MLRVTCTCTTEYDIPASAVDLSRCPKKGCAKPTRDVV
jgi:hypothetical protein